jgi:hypothetical protein
MWADLAATEAGITQLDNMASADERLRTLTAIRMVTRNREQYWLQIHIDRLIAVNTVFNCMVFSASADAALLEAPTITGYFYDVYVLQLGSGMQYRFFSFDELSPGSLVKGRIYRIQNNIKTSPHSAFLVVPADIDKIALPEHIQSLINYRSAVKKDFIFRPFEISKDDIGADEDSETEDQTSQETDDSGTGAGSTMYRMDEGIGSLSTSTSSTGSDGPSSIIEDGVVGAATIVTADDDV